MSRKNHLFLLPLILAILWMPAQPSAAENWSTTVWDGDMPKLEQLSAEHGITSGDVLWANDYTSVPPKGETLLVPNSKTEVVRTWMEAQNRKNGSGPLVTVKLHGVPAALRESPAEPQTRVKLHGMPSFTRDQASPPAAPTQRAPAPVVVPSPSVKSMAVVVSGDELIIATPTGDVIREKPSSENSAAASRAIRPVIPEPTSEALVSLPPLILNPPKQTPPKPPVSAVPVPSGKMAWPVGGKVSSGFGRRGKRHFHAGIDIPMPQGTPITAVQDGVVLEVSTIKSKKYRGYGNTALIDHGSGITTMYAHCQSVSVKAGQRVQQGDVVGSVGNTGRTTTHHIHFEVRKNGKPVDPLLYLTPR